VILAARLFLESLRFDLEPEDEVRRRAERALKLGAGGFVIFGGEAERIAHWVAEWRSAVRHRLWIASDLERGPGQQFGGLPELPPPLGLAASPDPLEAARKAGRITGRAARAVGVNLVLAPVLDLDVEPRNPIVGTRSFGSRPEEVGRLGRAWIEACQGEGVSARSIFRDTGERPRIRTTSSRSWTPAGPSFRRTSSRFGPWLTWWLR
jgi:beta-N-acetylhexosaminidase